MIFDGKIYSQLKEVKLTEEVASLQSRGITPKLIDILADNSPESKLYAALKEKFARKIGVIFEIHHFDGSATEEVVADIQKANEEALVHGIMIQLPVADEEKIVAAIDPKKDVDSLTPENLGLIMGRRPRFLPATVRAVIDILKEAKKYLPESGRLTDENKWLAGKNVVIIGASIIVGKPLAVILSDAGATVTICRSTTINLLKFTQNADILVSATGVMGLVKKEMVKRGAIVIDVGISKLLRDGKFRIVGDVDQNVSEKTSFLTPVPGGVGPVTVACLFENLVESIKIS
ncbi:bifunctional methylenetetrahydrofolate dehydrogenase/methenyltetrahydrofolate cyclohydrolase [Candidatus Shapirobacteria bacterium CG03_land_8_20_14_0_80_39_12]|uniref:Bifunctional protein FolD n=1 Tax=Candidatus Shapirobacteria bacterium CG03_land_8_20_14_0_80_39_12 TaxID=1974879 RepID=A0A2M7BE59_9BACT|nr:MAG: bifunctional methylenetetrahydrofolate dehydrogenase/methenyltetrahydrofolate cyclohydrolase [Candidatus Shapirobacteria bacterium CG03_land_8_20_14_0_80_39_12]